MKKAVGPAKGAHRLSLLEARAGTSGGGRQRGAAGR